MAIWRATRLKVTKPSLSHSSALPPSPLSLFFLFLSPLFSVLSFPVSGARCELWVKRSWIILRRFNCLTPNYIPHFLKPLSLVRMTAQTFSFRADSRGLRQILRLSRSVTQSVWPRFYLKSLWKGERKPFLYSVCHRCVVSVCCSFVVLVALLNVLISGRETENLPLNFCLSLPNRDAAKPTPPPSPPTSLPHHSLMKRPRDNIWHWSIDVTTRRLKVFCQ